MVAWGDNRYGQTNVPSGLTNVVAIASGGYHSLALKGDGTVVVWGWNALGQCNVPSGLTNVVAIAGGDSHSLALENLLPPMPNQTVAAGGAGGARRRRGARQRVLPQGLRRLRAKLARLRSTSLLAFRGRIGTYMSRAIW